MLWNFPPFNTTNSKENRPSVRQRSVSYRPWNIPVGSTKRIARKSEMHGAVNSNKKLQEVRKLMKKNGLDYYIIPGDDIHDLGYVHNTRRMRWISGFTGTAGQVIVSKTTAYLITDSRYSRQALRELDPNHDYFHHIQVGDIDGPTDWVDWLIDRANCTRVGIDARLLSCEAESQISKQLAHKSSKFVYPPQNFVDLFLEDKPPKRKYPIFIHDNGGEIQAAEKLHILQLWIKQQMHAAAIVTSLSSIAFLLNLCSMNSQLQRFPESCLFVSFQRKILFTESEEVTGAVRDYLDGLRVERKPYNDLWQFLERMKLDDGKVLISPQAPYYISLRLSRRCTVVPFIGNDEIAKMGSRHIREKERLFRDSFAISSNHGRIGQAPLAKFLTNAQGISAQDAKFSFIGRNQYDLTGCEVYVYNEIDPSVNNVDTSIGIPF